MRKYSGNIMNTDKRGQMKRGIKRLGMEKMEWINQAMKKMKRYPWYGTMKSDENARRKIQNNSDRGAIRNAEMGQKQAE
jgi:hypothetical protein